tara:strand:+ start:265160 stop:265459 length:300 start_codon:yes stop_codon:yes gene_type:complete
MRYLDQILKAILQVVVVAYRFVLSPVFRQFGGKCRFYPSCSGYALESLKVHGGAKGAWLTAKRLVKCGPFHPGGYDPVPETYEFKRCCHKSTNERSNLK